MSNRRGLVAVAEVDNPFFMTNHPEGQTNPRKVAVAVRRGAVRWMAKRYNLKPHQIAAGIKFGDIWERCGGMMRAAGPRDYVDINQAPSVVEDVIDASRQLRACQAALSRDDFWLVTEVCAKGNEVVDLFHGKHLRDRRRAARDQLKAALDDLACMWRYMHHKVVDTTDALSA